MRRISMALLAVGGLLVAVVAAYALFGLLLATNDVASYTSESTVVEGADFDAALARAEAAGYEVERPDSSGFHPEGIEALDDELGDDYEVLRVVFYHDAGGGGTMEATVYADEGVTEVEFFRAAPSGPFAADDLPAEAWAVERLALLFEQDEASARASYEDVVASLDDEERLVPGISVTDPVDVPAVHESFASRADEVTTSDPDGQGWHERRYYVDGERVGGLDLVLARAEITHRDGGHTYVVNLDRGGGVTLQLRARGGEEVPEAEYRAVFRELFETMGLPPEAVDGVTFEYDPSVW